MLPYASNAEKNQIQNDDEPYDYEKTKKIKWHHKILLNRPLKIVILLLLFAVLAPSLIYHLYFYNTLDLPPADGFSIGSCLLSRAARLPCGIGAMNDTSCHSQCCFDYNSNMCFHRFPSRFSYIMDVFWDENTNLHPRVATVPFKNQNSLPILRLSIDEITSTHLSIMFYDPLAIDVTGRRIEDKEYVHHISSPELSVLINRTNEHTIFNTIRGPVIASDNIWEIAFKLTEEKMYGLGEIPLEEGTVKVLYNNRNDPNTIPLIFAKSNGSYHGLLIDVEEPTEIIIEGENQILVRSITKTGVKFHVFTGPEPRDIMIDVKQLIGFDTSFEYWMLGPHICSEVAETNEDSLNPLSEFLNEATRENLPYESHCGAAPVLFEDEFCEENNSVEESGILVASAGKRFVPHISPHVRYEIEDISEEAVTPDGDSTTETTPYVSTSEPKCSLLNDFKDKFLRTADTDEVYTGKVGSYDVIYPEYKEVDDNIIEKMWNRDIIIDGLVLENNWPLDESYKNHNKTYEILPYFSKDFEKAFNSTPAWSILDSNDFQHINNHNAYGNYFVDNFRRIHPNISLWSTASFKNGKSGINRQNVDASWSSLQSELVHTALGGISGHWLWLSPICGDTENYNQTTQTSLCVKWYMAATYFPMIKVHSKTIPRHPLAFVGTNRNNIISALNHRLSLLPYFYTTLQTGPLLRPMFYQFPNSSSTQDLKHQFSVGDSLLIAPNLQPSQTHVHVTLPPGAWYEFWSGLPVGGEGQTVTMTTTEGDFLVFVRGSSIVAMQKDVKVTAEETRRLSDYTLVVALKCETTNITDHIGTEVTTTCIAEGTLYVNKALTLKFKADANELKIAAEGSDFDPLCSEEPTWANIIKDINVYGLENEHNNYDNHRHIPVNKNLCELIQTGEISITLV